MGEINGDFDNYVTSYPLYMQEFGHYLDSRVWGPLFSFAVGIPSAISAGSSDYLSTAPYSTHHYYWTEKRANRKAADYFGKYHNVDWFNDTFVYRNNNHTYEEVYPAYMY